MTEPLQDVDPATAAQMVDAGPLVVVCRSGGRSSKAATKLSSAGLAVHNLTGGMTAWENAGQPVIRDG
ncbi:MAG: rhodanese-like domain-containing protein, partial [Mycobacterium sp.]|nr:rhodanese-like domain-containing protein [Mycobacterium sp.]